MLGHVWFFYYPIDCSPQAPLPMRFPRQEYWTGLPLPSTGDLPSPGMKPAFPALADWLTTTEPSGSPSKKGRYKIVIYLKFAFKKIVEISRITLLVAHMVSPCLFGPNLFDWAEISFWNKKNWSFSSLRSEKHWTLEFIPKTFGT